MERIPPEVGTPVMYFSDVDMDGDLDPTFMVVGAVLPDGYVKLAPMGRVPLPPGFTNPVPWAPIPVAGHWTNRIDLDS